MEGLDLDLMGRVQQTVRRALREAARSRTYRDSPTGYGGLLNIVGATLTIDTQTGEAVTPEVARSNPGRTYLTFTIGGHADRNRIELSPSDREALDALLAEPGLSDAQRSVLQGLRFLDGQAMTETEDPLAALPAGSSGVELMPVIPAEQITEMRRALTGTARPGGRLMMTVGFSGLGLSIFPSVNIGAITLDAAGNIVATELMMPDFMSARGTTYRTGIVAGGTRVAVVTNGETLLHYEPGELTPRQEAALLALMHSTENVGRRDTYLASHPYAIDMTLHRGLGQLILDLNSELSFSSGATGQALILRERDGELRFEYWHEGDPRPEGTRAILRFTELEPMRPRREGGIEAGHFSYTVEGELPAPVAGMLDWVRGRVERDSPIID
jgi:hypothetical protein